MESGIDAGCEPEFAPEYTVKERLRLIAVFTTAGAALVLVTKGWFFPWLGRFANHADCETVLGLPGDAVLLYGLFVAFPLLVGTSLLALGAGPARLAWRTRRYPAPGEKVFKRTRIKTGWRAVAEAFKLPIGALCFFAIAAWGAGAASDLRGELRARPHHAACTQPR